MKIKMKELRGKDLEKVVELYIQERDNFCWAITLEEFVKHYLRQCDCCGEYVVLEERDVELEERKNWNGEILSCCEQCCQEIDSDTECEDEFDGYDEYCEYHNMGGNVYE